MSNEIIVVDKETGEITIPEQIVEAIRANEIAIREAKAVNDEFKARLLEAMEEYGVEKIQSDYFTVSYVGEHETIRLDPKEVRMKYPRVHAECSHVTPVKASVRVRLK